MHSVSDLEFVQAAKAVPTHDPQAGPFHIQGVGHPHRHHGGGFLQTAVKDAGVRGNFGDDGLLTLDALQGRTQGFFGPVPFGDLVLQLSDFLLQHGVVAFPSRGFAKAHDLVAQRGRARRIFLRWLLHR
jgi:hypothetical protein